MAMPDPQTTDSSPRWQRRPEARPEEILRAAMATFVERGFAATRMDELAARAGISKGTLYLYFPNKEELFQAAVRESVSPAIQAAEAAVAGHEGPALDLLHQLFERWAAVVLDPVLGGLCKLIIAEAANFPDTARFYMDEVVLRIRGIFRQVVEQAIANGEIRDLPAEMVVREMMTPVLFVSVWRHSLACYEPKPLDIPLFLATHLDVVLHGLKPRATAPGKDATPRTAPEKSAAARRREDMS
jgi:AcrR family transcriptional regulator